MKTLSQTILTAQTGVKLKPDLKVRLQQYDFPAKSTDIRHNDFDWTEIWRGNCTHGVKAVCASDGSLILAYVNSSIGAETGVHIFRYTGPDQDTDFSAGTCLMSGHADTYTAESAVEDIEFVPTLGVFNYNAFRINPQYALPNTDYYVEPYPDYDLAANDAGEVIFFWCGIYPYVNYKVSSDNGATWGATQKIGWVFPEVGSLAYTVSSSTTNPLTYSPLYGNTDVYGRTMSRPHRVAASYNDKGELCLVALAKGFTPATGIMYRFRKNGVWIDDPQDGALGYTWNNCNVAYRGPGLGNGFDNFFTLREASGSPIGACGTAPSSTALAGVFLTSIDLEWDGDWIGTIDFYQTNPWHPQGGKLANKHAPAYFIIWDDNVTPPEGGSLVGYNNDWLMGSHKATPYGRLNMASSTAAINSLNDFATQIGSSQSMNLINAFPPSLVKKLGGIFDHGKTLVKSDGTVDTDQGSPYSFLHKIDEVYLTICDGDKVLFLKKRPDMELSTGIFSDGAILNLDCPLGLVSNSDYAFAYNSNAIFISPLPTTWEKPTIGTGAGDYLDIAFNRILSVKENTNDGQVASLDIVLNNYDGYFDTPESAPVNISRGVRVGLFLGYYTTVSNLNEYARYFVDSWSFSREDNMSLFIVKCVDAWGLLNQYTFPKPVKFNQFEDTYTVYELIEMLVNTIGGALTVQSKSAEIDAIYPRVIVNSGETAASVLKRLLFLVPDVIKWFGSDATLIKPLSTDTVEYNFKFPS